MRALPVAVLVAMILGAAFVACGGGTTKQAQLPSVGTDTLPAVPDPIGVYIVKADGSGLKLLTTISGRPMWSWSANGDRAALVTDISQGTAKVHVLSIPDGAEEATFDADGRPINMEWSPGGEWLALTYSSPDQTSGLEVIRADGSTRGELTAVSVYTGQVKIVGWTAADRLLAAREDASSTELLVFDLTNGGSREVAALPGWATDVTLSKDASRVAAIVWAPPGADCAVWPPASLWTVDVRDGQSKDVLDRCGLFAAVWSPDGRQIAYSLGADDETRGVYALDIASGASHRLGGSAIEYDEVQAWLPDGSGVVAARNACPDIPGAWCISSPPQIVLIPTTGGEEKIMVSDADNVALSPDGATLAYDKDGLQLVDIRGGTLQSIASPDSDWQFNLLDWSPDGQWFSFARSHSRGFRQFEVNADGSGLKRLDDLSDWPDMPPWDDGEVPSPDGGKVAVLGNPLQINDAQGGNQVSVDGVHSGQASWSADGKTLVFATCPLTSEGASTIYLVAADGTGLRQLTDGSSRDCQPVFSPDGQSVTFVRVRDKVEQVVALDLGTLEERVLFSIDVTYGYDGDWPAWSPDESLIALSIQGMGIYVVKTDGSGAQQVVTTDWFGGQFVGLRWQSNSRLYFVSAAIGGD